MKHESRQRAKRKFAYNNHFFSFFFFFFVLLSSLLYRTKSRSVDQSLAAAFDVDVIGGLSRLAGSALGGSAGKVKRFVTLLFFLSLKPFTANGQSDLCS